MSDFKVIREIETPISREIDVTTLDMPVGLRKVIPGVIETVLEIEGPCEKMPDAITLNGARYIPENVCLVGPLDEAIKYEDGVWKRGKGE